MCTGGDKHLWSDDKCRLLVVIRHRFHAELHRELERDDIAARPHPPQRNPAICRSDWSWFSVYQHLWLCTPLRHTQLDVVDLRAHRGNDNLYCVACRKLRPLIKADVRFADTGCRLDVLINVNRVIPLGGVDELPILPGVFESGAVAAIAAAFIGAEVFDRVCAKGLVVGLPPGARVLTA